jgi:hypothetical protein
VPELDTLVLARSDDGVTTLNGPGAIPVSSRSRARSNAIPSRKAPPSRRIAAETVSASHNVRRTFSGLASRLVARLRATWIGDQLGGRPLRVGANERCPEREFARHVEDGPWLNGRTGRAD